MDKETTDRVCPWDAKPLINPRSNQTYCNAQCRKDHAASLKGRNDKPASQTRKCTECDEPFETDKPDKEFCSPKCQQAWNNFWKSRGPGLAKVLHQWRVKRTPGSFTKMTQAYSKARKAHKHRREEKKGMNK